MKNTFRFCLLVLMLFSCARYCVAQASKGAFFIHTDGSLQKIDTSLGEKMPSFKGDMAQFLGKNLNYPDKAIESGFQGKVYLQIKISETGSVIGIDIITSSGFASLDSEAVRVCRIMPPWNPAMQSGVRMASVWYLPIGFSLDDGPPKKSRKRRHLFN